MAGTVAASEFLTEEQQKFSAEFEEVWGLCNPPEGGEFRHSPRSKRRRERDKEYIESQHSPGV